MEDGSFNITNTGSVNERGLINDLNKRGFSDFNSLCEIYANSLEEKSLFQAAYALETKTTIPEEPL